MTPDKIRQVIEFLVESGVPIGQAELQVVQSLSPQDYDTWVKSADRAAILTSSAGEAFGAAATAFPLARLGVSAASAASALPTVGRLSDVGVAASKALGSPASMIGSVLPQSTAGRLAVGGLIGSGIGAAEVLRRQLTGGEKEPLNPYVDLAQPGVLMAPTLAPGAGDTGTEDLENVLGLSPEQSKLFRLLLDSGADPLAAYKYLMGGAEGGGDSTALARLGLDRERFAAEQANFERTFVEGQKQFDRTYGLQLSQLGLSQQEYAARRDEFARSFAEQQRQFDVTEGRLGRAQDLEAELGRGRLGLEARQLGLSEELGRGQLALAQQQAAAQQSQFAQAEARQRLALEADILRRPSDFIARAFTARGATPSTVVTQADLVNQLRASAPPGYAAGGATTEGRFIVGDSKSGKPTGNEELILNPTGAPIQVVPMGNMGEDSPSGDEGWEESFLGKLIDKMLRIIHGDEKISKMDWRGLDRVPRYATGTATSSGPYGGWLPALTSGMTSGQISDQEVSGLFGKLGNIYTPQAQQQGYDPFYTNPYVQDPTTGVYYVPGFEPAQQFAPNAAKYQTAPVAQPAPQLSQEELIRYGRENLPPGARAALYGGTIAPARLAGELTLNKLGRLTQPELEALNTQLALEYQSDIPTEYALLQQRFGPAVTRARGRLALG